MPNEALDFRTAKLVLHQQGAGWTAVAFNMSLGEYAWQPGVAQSGVGPGNASLEIPDFELQGLANGTWAFVGLFYADSNGLRPVATYPLHAGPSTEDPIRRAEIVDLTAGVGQPLVVAFGSDDPSANLTLDFGFLPSNTGQSLPSHHVDWNGAHGDLLLKASVAGISTSTFADPYYETPDDVHGFNVTDDRAHVSQYHARGPGQGISTAAIVPGTESLVVFGARVNFVTTVGRVQVQATSDGAVAQVDYLQAGAGTSGCTVDWQASNRIAGNAQLSVTETSAASIPFNDLLLAGLVGFPKAGFPLGLATYDIPRLPLEQQCPTP